MYLSRFALSALVFSGRVLAAIPVVARQGTTTTPFVQSGTPGAPSTTLDWWPFEDFSTSSASQPFLASSSSSQSQPTISSTSSLSFSRPPQSSSPSIIDITALPPSITNPPHPRIRTKGDAKPFSLAPVFLITGLVLGALVGWPAFNAYEKWAAKSAAVPLLRGPAYVPVNHVNQRTNGDRRDPMSDVHGSPSKHTRHGNPYSVGRGFLGRIPPPTFHKPPLPTSQERTKSTSSEGPFAWPSIPASSRSTPIHSRPAANRSAKSVRTTTAISDDPFTSTASDARSQTVVAASRTSTRSTFAHTSKFGEIWSDDEDEHSVVISPISPSLPVEGEGEAKTGLFKIRSKPKSAKRKVRDEESTGSASELSLPIKETSPRKSSWSFPWVPGSPSVKPESYTTVPARTSSPRPRSFRTPESSPRKSSYVCSSEDVRFVDTSVLPSSPPTLTSPRLQSELFLTALEAPGPLAPRFKKVSRTVTRQRAVEERDDAGTSDPTSPSSPQPGNREDFNENRSLTKRSSRTGPSRHLSTASVSTISEFPGSPPPKRTPAERFHARHAALGKVEEIIQKSRSQTSIANLTVSPGRSAALDTVEEGRQFGRAGREFGSGGIEQRLFES